jgi:hypothetical protein
MPKRRELSKATPTKDDVAPLYSPLTCQQQLSPSYPFKKNNVRNMHYNS